MASESAPWLRIALVRDDRIVDEHWISEESLIVGTDEHAHVLCPSFASRELFGWREGAWELALELVTEGRVGTSRGVCDVDALRGERVLRLHEDARGRVRVGDVTLLFEVRDRRVVTPRAPLPAAARGGLSTQIDVRFTAFVVASFTAFFGLAVALESSDFPVTTESIATERLARLVFSEPAPPPEPTERHEPTPDDRARTPDATETTVVARADRTDRARSTTTSASDRARIAEEASDAVQQLLLGARGLRGFADALAGGAPGTRAEDVLGDATTFEPATASASQLRARDGGGSGETGELGLIARRAVSATEPTPTTTERTISDVRIERFEPIGGSGDFDPAVVARAMRARLSAFRRCYEQVLRREPTLAGRWTVQLRITERGSVDLASIADRSTHSEPLESCVLDAARRVRVHPAPVGGSVTVAYPLVFAPQG